MKRVILLLCLGGLARTLPGQLWPPIGSIDVYGLHTVSEDQVRRALGVKEGDRPPASAAALSFVAERPRIWYSALWAEKGFPNYRARVHGRWDLVQRK